MLGQSEEASTLSRVVRLTASSVSLVTASASAIPRLLSIIDMFVNNVLYVSPSRVNASLISCSNFLRRDNISRSPSLRKRLNEKKSEIDICISASKYRHLFITSRQCVNRSCNKASSSVSLSISLNVLRMICSSLTMSLFAILKMASMIGARVCLGASAVSH